MSKLKLESNSYYLTYPPYNVLIKDANKIVEYYSNKNITKNNLLKLNKILKSSEKYVKEKNIIKQEKLNSLKKKREELIKNRNISLNELKTNKNYIANYLRFGYKDKKIDELKSDLKILREKKKKNISINEDIKLNYKIKNTLNRLEKLTGYKNHNITNANYYNIKNSTIDLSDELNKLLEYLSSSNLKEYEEILFVDHIKNLKNIENFNNNININLFTDNIKLFKKFEKNNGSPFSEYDFLYGIDKISLLRDKKNSALLFIFKTIFVKVIKSFPMWIAKVSKKILLTTGTPIGLLLSSSIAIYMSSKYLFYYYRESKRYFKKTIFFCTKYMPFEGLECFRSSLYSIYHKLFYYSNQNINESIEKYFESIIGKNFSDENKFIERNILFIKYCSEYSLQLSNLDFFKNNIKNINKESLKNIEKDVENDIKNKLTKTGGSQEEILTALHSDIKNNFKLKKQSTFSDYLSNEQVVMFRFNYKIPNQIENFLLCSGDINIEDLFTELSDIINSRSSYLTHELQSISKKIPFFVNDYLIDNLKSLYRYSSIIKGDIFFVRYSIVDFIKIYIYTFLMFYLISKYNIIKLIIEQKIDASNLLLEKIFNNNLKYTFLGRYKSITTNFKSYDKEIMLRDKINYYSILLKYSYLALDHIIKKFKITVINDYDNKIYKENNNCENIINNFFGESMIKTTVFSRESIPSYNNSKQIPNKKNNN